MESIHKCCLYDGNRVVVNTVSSLLDFARQPRDSKA